MQGRNTEVMPVPGSTSATALAGSEEMNTIDHEPFSGNSTSPTLRNCVPLWLNTVSKICLTLL